MLKFRPSIISYTVLYGNTPLLFLARTVRSVGCVFNSLLTGPLPFASMPWHAPQLDRYSVLLPFRSYRQPLHRDNNREYEHVCDPLDCWRNFVRDVGRASLCATISTQADRASSPF